MHMSPWMSQSQMQHMPMMGWHTHVGQTQFYPDSPTSIVALHNPVPAGAASNKRGKAVYVSQCASCHGYSAKSVGGVDLTSLGRQNDGELFWIITEGRNQMPSFAATLSKRQRWDVVNYLRTLGE